MRRKVSFISPNYLCVCLFPVVRRNEISDMSMNQKTKFYGDEFNKIFFEFLNLPIEVFFIYTDYTTLNVF